MTVRIRALPILCLAAAVLLAPFSSAQDRPSADRVLATVNGTDITLGHVLALRAGLPAQYSQIPEAALFNGVLEQLIQQTLLMQARGDAPLSRRAELLLENERRAIVAGEMIQDIFENALSDETVQAAYEAEYTTDAQETEYKASHILVETREQAEALTEELAQGANFAALAQEHSVGPSGASGGSLGWFGDGVMVAPFFEAVAALAPGQVSEPLETQFGWHVILLEETRLRETPPLADVRAEIEDSLQQQALEDRVGALEESGNVERADISDIDPAVVNALDLLEN